MNTRMTKEYLEKMGEIVNKQITGQDNNNKYNGFHPHMSLNHQNNSQPEEKFEPQTPAQKKFYGELAHKKLIGDYVSALLGDEHYQDIPAKEGVYQLCIKNGLFSDKQHSPEEIKRRKEFLFHEYMKSEDETYREFANLQSRL